MMRFRAWVVGPVAALMLLGLGVWLWSRVDGFTDLPVVGVVVAVIMSSLILRKQPGNVVAKLLMAAALPACLQVVSEAYWLLVGAPVAYPGFLSLIAAKMVVIGGTLGFGIFLVLLPIVFPTGEPHARWSRWLLVGAIFLIVGQVLGVALTGQAMCVAETDSGVCSRYIDDPPGLDFVPNPTEPPLEQIFGPAILLAIVGGLSAAVARYRSSTGSQHMQMKWFALAAFVSVLFIPPAILINVLFGASAPDWLFNLPFIFLPVGIAIASLRYRLYDIDRIISRTVSYVLVVGLFGLLYGAGAVWLPTRILGEQSPLFVAGSTLAMAALFTPLRRRVQRRVDRRFNRSRYDSQLVMDQFAASLQDRVDANEVVGGWIEAVSDTMQPSRISVWVR